MKSLTDMAENPDVSTAQVLTALRIVATRAGVTEVATWAAKEMEGYGPTDELPPHRSWKLSIVGTLRNGSQVWQDCDLGDLSIADQDRAEATTYCCRDGVGDLEHMLANHQSSDGDWAVEHPNLAVAVNAGPMLSTTVWQCTQATAKFSRVHLVKVVSRARQTALKFCLECEAKDVELKWAPDDDTSNAERRKWLNTLRQEGTKVAFKAAWGASKAAWDASKILGSLGS